MASCLGGDMATLEQVTAVGLKNILLSTDFSTASAHALAHAITLARHYHAKLHIVHVLKSPAHEGIPLDLLPELDRKHQEAEAAMLGIMRTPELQDISHDVWLQAGPIWNALSSLIENTKIDLLMLGTSGREGLKKLLMGSVAEEVFRRAACPVLTVGPQVTAPSGTTTEL